MAENNIGAVEISMSYSKYKDINYHELAELSRKYGVELWSYHLPFMPFLEIDLSSTNADVKKSTKEYLTELIKKGSDIGVDKFVVHASGEPIEDSERQERIKNAMESLDYLAGIAYQCGACIAVEDLPRSCLGNTSDEIKLLLSANDKLRVCFDTNHLLTEDNIHFMENLGDKIITLHISDYDFINERHWLPGEGKNDWNKFVSKLKEINYTGVWMYEIELECPNTILRDRRLDFNDFYENARSIMRGEKPHIFSEPKENLGFWE